jgi:TolB-like protein
MLAAGALWLAVRPKPPTVIRSLVVLPLVNLSAHPDQEYISDGLTEEIINALALTPRLKVVARTSAFQFKGNSVDVRTIGATLGADAVLEGSVRLDGTRLRVTAQLNSSRDGYHYWSHTWEHAMQDLFVVEQEVAHEVVEALGQRGLTVPQVKTAYSQS